MAKSLSAFWPFKGGIKMDKKELKRLKYYPCAPESDDKALERIKRYFDNATRPDPLAGLSKSKQQDNWCDSGGLQALRAEEEGRIPIIDPIMETDINDPDFFILGSVYQCEEYGRRNSSKAMLIDLPVWDEDDDLAYLWKITESRKARDDMLEWKELLCPNTQFGIVLQPRNPLEVEDYFLDIFTPKVGIYAYPIRNFRNAPKDSLGNAFVLSFLNDMGVNYIHFLGSNAPVIIFLLAHAISLGLFEQASFDSLTWYQPACSRAIRFMDPETLTPMPKKQGLHPLDNLRTATAKFKERFDNLLGCFNPPKLALAKEWTGIFNIRMIEEFKNRVLEIALTDDLRDFIKQFPKYKGQKGKILEALDLLEESKDFGHEYIEQKYESKIEELYM